MSRLAKKPLTIPSGVTVNVNAKEFIVEGPKGKLQRDIKPEFVEIAIDGNQAMVNRKGNSKPHKAFQGLYWSLLKNALIGVTQGYSKKLMIQGVGYKWEVKGKKLICNVGLSHKVEFDIPENIEVKSESANLITVSGFDKRLVGQVVANIRFIKPPEPYKGKGIRYENETVKLKEGKSAKK